MISTYLPEFISSPPDKWLCWHKPKKPLRYKLRYRNNAALQELYFSDSLKDNELTDMFGAPKEEYPALAYAGTQFGRFNPCLGDGRSYFYGRAYTISGLERDITVKGAGATLYAKGNGYLSLNSAMKEAEYSKYLSQKGVPTTKVLAVLEVEWEDNHDNPWAILVRSSKSALRVGTLEYLCYNNFNDTLEAVMKQQLKIHSCDSVESWLELAVEKICKLGVEWEMHGFVHGCLNTDNFSLGFETLDFGTAQINPSKNPDFIATDFDPNGYYRFGKQQQACQVALFRIGNCLKTLMPVSSIKNILQGAQTL